MKKLVIMMIAMMVSFASFAQKKDVTKFLGIPVDGTVASVKQKLKAKGFKQSPFFDSQLEGRFNGYDSYVGIIENNGKVWRISVGDKVFTDETNIRIRFNNLCQQFLKNKKYVPTQKLEEMLISDDTDISYEMTVGKKRFQAVFFQEPSDSSVVKKVVMNALLEKYTSEQIAAPTEEISNDVSAISIKVLGDLLSKKTVWFMINENYGSYSITIFYDNEYNKADGEDL